MEIQVFTMDQSTDSASIRLLSDLSDADGAAMTFDRVLQRIRDASESIVIHMFVWRNDAIGNQIVTIGSTNSTGTLAYDLKIPLAKDLVGAEATVQAAIDHRCS